MTATVLALIGAKALYLLFAWLLSAIVASYLSGRKGYGERIGLASGLILAVVGVVIWVFWPAKPESDWKALGPFGRPKAGSEQDLPSPKAGQGPSGPGETTGARV